MLVTATITARYDARDTLRMELNSAEQECYHTNLRCVVDAASENSGTHHEGSGHEGTFDDMDVSLMNAQAMRDIQ